MYNRSQAICEGFCKWCIIWDYISWLQGLKRQFQNKKQKYRKKPQFLPGITRPEPHPIGPCWKYFKWLQLFWAEELETVWEVYSCMLECNCEKIGSAGSFYACVILAAVLLLLNVLHKEKEVNCVRRLRWGQLIDYWEKPTV